MGNNNRTFSPWKVVTGSGIIAGLVFLGVEMILAAITSPNGMFGPLKMIASIVMGESILDRGIEQGTVVVLIATFVHIMLSVTYTGILFAVVQSMKKPAVMLSGAVFGLVLYLVNFYAFTELFFWFASERNWMSLVSHLVFGLTASYCITRFFTPEPDEPEQMQRVEEKKKTVVREREEELVE